MAETVTPFTAEVVYQGQLRTQVTHLYSGSTMETDAPLDNHGLAQRLSPTDTTAASLGSCMMTVMGIVANREGWALEGTKINVRKHMASNPRRISQIDVEVHFPAGEYDAHKKAVLENTARTCPVSHSLHPDIVQNILFFYGE